MNKSITSRLIGFIFTVWSNITWELDSVIEPSKCISRLRREQFKFLLVHLKRSKHTNEFRAYIHSIYFSYRVSLQIGLYFICLFTSNSLTRINDTWQHKTNVKQSRHCENQRKVSFECIIEGIIAFIYASIMYSVFNLQIILRVAYMFSGLILRFKTFAPSFRPLTLSLFP